MKRVDHNCWLRRLPLVATLAVLGFGSGPFGVAWASPQQIDIPAGDLTSALRLLADQTGIEFVYSADQLFGIKTAGVRGVVDADQALEKLLEGTGLSAIAHRSGARLISTKPRTASQLPKSKTVESLARGSAASAGSTLSEDNEVIVTATLREQLLQKVPISMHVWSAADMGAMGISDLKDAAPYTPGLTVSDKGNFVSISVRGIGSVSGAATTGIYIDDTPLQARALANSTSSQALPVTFDLERIEVLRGPQGTLFGAGSEGGTIRYITTPPSLTTVSGVARAELSSTNGGEQTYEVGVAAGGPVLRDVLGIRASAWYRRDGGWIDRVDPTTFAPIERNNNYGESGSARIAATWAPTASLNLNAGIFYQQSSLHDHQTYWDFLSDPGDSHFVSAGPSRAPNEDSFTLASLKLVGDFENSQLTSSTSLLSRNVRNDSDGTLAYLAFYQAMAYPEGTLPLLGPDCLVQTPCYPFVDSAGLHLSPSLADYRVSSGFRLSQQSFTQEMRLQSAKAPNQIAWTLGAFFSTAKNSAAQRDRDPDIDSFFRRTFGIAGCTALSINCDSMGKTPLVNGDTTYVSREQGEDRQIAGFGEIEVPFSRRFRFIAGLRYSHLEISSEATADGPINSGRSFAAGDERQDAWTERLGLTYEPASDHMVYATVSTGFRPGGVNAPISEALCADDLAAFGIREVPAAYDSDEVRSLEIGTKNRFSNELRIAASIFLTRWQDVLQNVTLPTCGSAYTTNLGEAKSQGMDFSVDWPINDSLQARATLGYTDATYIDSVYAGPDATFPLVEGGAHIVAGQGAYSQPLPPWTFSAGAQYNFRVRGSRSFVRVDYSFAAGNDGPFAGHTTNNGSGDSGLAPTSDQSLLGVRAGVQLGAASVTLFVDNVLNSHAILSVNNTALYASNPSASIRPLYTYSTFRPRTAGINITLKY